MPRHSWHRGLHFGLKPSAFIVDEGEFLFGVPLDAGHLATLQNAVDGLVGEDAVLPRLGDGRDVLRAHRRGQQIGRRLDDHIVLAGADHPSDEAKGLLQTSRARLGDADEAGRLGSKPELAGLAALLRPARVIEQLGAGLACGDPVVLDGLLVRLDPRTRGAYIEGVGVLSLSALHNDHRA